MSTEPFWHTVAGFAEAIGFGLLVLAFILWRKRKDQEKDNE